MAKKTEQTKAPLFHRFANPNRFLKLADLLTPWVGALTVGLFAVGLYWGLFIAPPDYQQGETAQIMFVHVPAAWMALMCWVVMAVAAFVGFVWKHPLADIVCKASAPAGAAFALICLITGSIWGKPMWGTWWVWDARLTSMLFLFFQYLGYMALVNAFDNPERGTRAGGLLALVGLVNVFIVKYSVTWWNSLHQAASVARVDGPHIDSAILWPLLIMALAYKALYVWVLFLRMRYEIAEAKLRSERLAQIHGGA